VSTPYLWDNAVLDRHAKLACGLPVDDELEFAERLAFLMRFPNGTVAEEDELLDSFLDRKRAYARTEAGGVRYGVLLIVACLGLFGWGWTHSSSAPNGATLLAIVVLALAIAVPTLVIKAARRADRAAAALTTKREGRLQQNTTGDHILDGA
jgi:hypothetical protein